MLSKFETIVLIMLTIMLLLTFVTSTFAYSDIDIVDAMNFIANHSVETSESIE